MTLQDQLMEDMKNSMKAGDAKLTGVLRLLRSAVKNEEIRTGHALTNDEIVKLLQKEAKQRRDSAQQYHAAGRAELANQEEYELEVIGRYLPEPMSEPELIALVDKAVAQIGANSMAQMGQVVSLVMSEAGARADGSNVARLIRERLG
jgi:uncharacterized protein